VIVVIDDAGDAGFKFSRGSSRYFVIACVIFNDDVDAEMAAERIRQFRFRKGWNRRYELKFNKLRKDMIKELLGEIVKCRLRVRAVVVDKTLVQSHELRSKPESFYNYIIKEVLARNDSMVSASVTLDGAAGKAYKRKAAAYFRREINQYSRKIAMFSFADSAEDDLVQIADLVAGSIYRSRQANKTDSESFLRIIEPRLEDLWEFGES
jgi:hypothetical protein